MIYTFSGNFCFALLMVIWWMLPCWRFNNFLKHFPHSAWFQLSEGSDLVSVVFKRNGSELVRGGHVIAKNGCWSLLKGGIVANFSSPAEILFEVKWFSSYLVLYIT
jgi:hypothetical protein